MAGRPAGRRARADLPSSPGAARIRPRRGAPRPRARQRGLTLVLLLAVVTMSALYMMVSQLTRVAQRVDRDIVTAKALGEAKQALIGYAARDRRLRPRSPDRAAPPPGPPDPTSFYYSGALVSGYGAGGIDIQPSDRPGSLPCPAPDESGIALPADACASWSTAGAGVWKNRVGWLPWRTLGVPPLRDADGNLLWYAVSDSVRNGNLNSGGPPLVLNSDIVHRAAPDPFAFKPLTVQGSVPAQNVVAVVIAPGQALSGQDRDGAKYSVRSYLEGANNYLDNDAGSTSDDVFEMQPRSTTFNDTLASITAAELFAVVENAVALRIQRTVMPLLEQYYADWGALPYPAVFDADKARADFTGVLPTAGPPAELPLAPPVTVASTAAIAGQLPLLRMDDVQWSPTVTIKQLVSPGFGAFDPTTQEQDPAVPATDDPPSSVIDTATSTCTPTVVTDAPDVLACTINYTALGSGRPWVKITATVPVGARGLVGAVAPPVTTFLLASESVAGRASWDGSVSVDYKARLSPAAGTVGIDFTGPAPAPRLDSPGGDTAWFVRNEWHRLVRYGLAPGAVPERPAGVSECTASTTATCLDARRANGVVEFSRAVLVLAGSKSFKAGPAAQLRQDEGGAATTDLANYFEAGNLSADLQYEERRRADQPAAAFNDRLAGYRAP